MRLDGRDAILIADPFGYRFLDPASGAVTRPFWAANRGASLAAGKTIGLNISLPHEQVMNPYVSNDLIFNFHYFFMRKFWFVYLAKALVVFPGGFGTMDEMFEVLTLIQTRKPRKRMPVFAVGGITAKSAAEARFAGAHGVAMIRVAMEAADPAARIRELLAAITG